MVEGNSRAAYLNLAGVKGDAVGCSKCFSINSHETIVRPISTNGYVEDFEAVIKWLDATHSAVRLRFIVEVVDRSWVACTNL